MARFLRQRKGRQDTCKKQQNPGKSLPRRKTKIRQTSQRLGKTQSRQDWQTQLPQEKIIQNSILLRLLWQSRDPGQTGHVIFVQLNKGIG